MKKKLMKIRVPRASIFLSLYFGVYFKKNAIHGKTGRLGVFLKLFFYHFFDFVEDFWIFKSDCWNCCVDGSGNLPLVSFDQRGLLIRLMIGIDVYRGADPYSPICADLIPDVFDLHTQLTDLEDHMARPLFFEFTGKSEPKVGIDLYNFYGNICFFNSPVNRG